MAAIIRLRAVIGGRFSSRHMVGCEQRSSPLSGGRPTAILNAGSLRSVLYQPWEVLTDALLSDARLGGQHRSVRR
jgi:hypothetical protein